MAAGVLVRLFYYLVTGSGDQDMLLYSDDFLITAGRKEEIIDLAGVLLLWVALGVPWKWRKFRGGFEAEWIGYHVDFSDHVLGISARRAEWLALWCEKTVEEKRTRLEDLRAVMGRLGFSLGALEYLRPIQRADIRVGCSSRKRWDGGPPMVHPLPALIHRRATAGRL